MRDAFHGLLVVALMVACLVPLPAEPQRQGTSGRGAAQGTARPPRDTVRPQDVAGTAAIRGRVISAETGAPVRRAQIQARASTGAFRAVLSDDDGWFELRDLPAARWTVVASKSGYVSRQYGQRRPGDSSTPIALDEGQQFLAEIALWKGGVIAGRVYDEHGEPAAGVRVQAQRTQRVDGESRLAAAGVADQTDDTGAFRLYGLTPGEYIVVARSSGAGAVLDALQAGAGRGGVGARILEVVADRGGALERQTGGRAPTYFPGTSDPGEAQRIVVGAGEEHTGISFALTAVPTVRVSGTIVTSSGQPPSGRGIVSLVSDRGLVGGPDMVAGIRAGGEFSLPAVAPGSYLLNVTTTGADGELESASVPVQVGVEPVSGITVMTGRAGSLSGTIATEGGTLPQSRIVVRARPAEGTLSFRAPGAGTTAEASGTGRFQLRGLSGSTIIQVDGIPEGWMLKSITVDGDDATDMPVEFRTGQQSTARIVLTNRIGELRGRVSMQGGSGPEADVVVFPADPSKWTARSRYIRTARVEGGAFSMRGLPPLDDYMAAALEWADPQEVRDPAFLERLTTVATRFALGEGESRQLDLRLVLRN